MNDQQPDQTALYELDDDRGQLHRHVQALRRGMKLIVAIVACATAGALLLSLTSSYSYRATARLVQQGDGSAPSSDLVERQLTTDNALVTSGAVLRRAADSLTGLTPREVKDRISSTVSPKANLIEISATAPRGTQAAAIANTVAQSFLAERNRAARIQLARQRRILARQIERLGGARAAAAGDQVSALQRRMDELAVDQATVGSDLEVAEPAAAPAHPSSPRPLLTAVLAFFASLTIGILVALGREHLNPRAASQRDVARVLGIPVLATIPERTRRPLSRTGMLVAAERDAFQSLRTAVEAAMPPGVQKVFVVSSATPGEGKTTVAYRLARSLVSAGQSVLLVGGDLRRPGIGACVGLPNSPGVSDLLGNAASASRAVSGGAIARATRTFMPSDAAASGWATLAVLPSGDPPEDPTALLARDLVWSLFEQIRRLDYEWVVVDAPPVLGPADARVLAGVADALLLVSRLGAVTMEQLRSEREAIDTLEVEPLGVVVIGAPVEPGAYELGPVRRDRNHSRAPLAVRPERLRRPRAVPID